MSKLTLDVPDELVAAAKREAAARRTSLSKLVSDFFASFDANTLTSESELDLDLDRLAPKTRRLVGCISSADADVDSYTDYLERKHS